MQDFKGEAAYAPFHDDLFKQQVAQSSLHQLSLMQKMLDWREGEIQNEISLLDNAEASFTGNVIIFACLPYVMQHKTPEL